MMKASALDTQRRQLPAQWSSTIPHDLVSVIILVVLVTVLFLTLRYKFGDLIVDNGREANYGERVLNGELPYRDFFYEYGPLVPYLIAGLYKTFGVSLDVLRGLGVALALFSAIAFYALARAALSACWSLFASITFVIIFQFSFLDHYNIFNFVLPYTFSATIGLLILLLLSLLHCRLPGINASTAALVSGVLLGIALMTKLEIAVASIAFHLVYALTLRSSRSTMPLSRLRYALYVGTAALAVIIYPLFWFSRHVDIIDYGKTVLGLGLHRTPFLDRVMGTDDVIGNLIGLVVSLANVLLIGALAFSSEWLDNRRIQKHGRNVKVLYKVASLTAIGVVAYFIVFQRLHPLNVFRACALGSVACGLFIYFRRKNAADGFTLPIEALIAAALVLAAKMPLSLSAMHYGFYLTPLSFLLSFILLASELPSFLRARYGISSRSGLYGSGIALFTIAVIAGHVQFSMENFGKRNHSVQTVRGRIDLKKDHADALDKLSAYFLSTNYSGDTLAVLPEGLMVNFLLNKASPLYHPSANPLYFATAGSEEKFVREFLQGEPQHIAIVTRWMDEGGASVFGRDYFGSGINRILEAYEPVVVPDGPVFEDADIFRVMLLKKRTEPDLPSEG